MAAWHQSEEAKAAKRKRRAYKKVARPGGNNGHVYDEKPMDVRPPDLVMEAVCELDGRACKRMYGGQPTYWLDGKRVPVTEIMKAAGKARDNGL